MIFDEFAEDYFGRLGELRGSLDCLHDNGYDDYDSLIPKIFVRHFLQKSPSSYLRTKNFQKRIQYWKLRSLSRKRY